MESENNWFAVKNIDEIDSPALVVYPERIKYNIRLLKETAGTRGRLRPHVKTHKMAEVVQLLIHEGINKFKCATIAEAEMLALEKAGDVLLAYQPVGPKINRLVQLVNKYPDTRFSCLVDDEANAEAIDNAFRLAGSTIGAFVDVNVGMNRTGIVPGPKALQLYYKCIELPALDIKGFHAYDGHIRDCSFEEREKLSNKAFEPVWEMVSELRAQKGINPVIVAGGSPTFPVHAKNKEIECSPGTFIFWDWGYHVGLPESKFLLAALVVSRVVSIVDKNLLCLDLGHKAIAAENPIPSRVKFLNHPDAEPVSQSEEHLTVRVEDTRAYKLGDVFYGAPYHICPTSALHQAAYVVENSEAKSQWAVISRNRVLSI